MESVRPGIRPLRGHRFAGLLGLALLVGMGAASSAQQPSPGVGKKTPPRFRGVTPSVVVGSSTSSTVRLRGTGLADLSKVTVATCDGARVDLPVTNQAAAQPSFVLSASLLVKPCVLRISSEVGGDFPLAIADAQLAKLKPPAYDPDAWTCWGAMFNRVFGAVQITPVNPDDAIVGINFMEPGCAPVFVLGKNDTPLFRLKLLPQKNNDESDKSTIMLSLPGVREGDVQWGPRDKENFWLGTLSDDGSQILVRKPLSDMVLEPSGSLDKN